MPPFDVVVWLGDCDSTASSAGTVPLPPVTTTDGLEA